MSEKSKITKLQSVIKQFQDIRAIGLAVFGVIVILVTWSGIGAVETNYSLQKQISALQEQNQNQSLQNNNLQLQNQYYNTNEYLELEARQLLGKAEPGEKVLNVQTSLALAQLAILPSNTNSQSQNPPPKPLYQSNFEAWMNFYFHRNQD
ncbi:MAG TPA: septum formation initiator family protein [Candidatus Saccharimonadales bacterium]|nr:septum formation initiator family protein [Candidatus Saccharimonadales bacterium]